MDGDIGRVKELELKKGRKKMYLVVMEYIATMYGGRNEKYDKMKLVESYEEARKMIEAEEYLTSFKIYRVEEEAICVWDVKKALKRVLKREDD